MSSAGAQRPGAFYWSTKEETCVNALIINCSPVKCGATAEIVRQAAGTLSPRHTVRAICIDDFDIHFCRGCRMCHQTAACVQRDDMDAIIASFEWAGIILSVSPSYWADVPGQFKAFIDRCTPWCNTHEPHAALSPGKRGYVIALRTGSSMRECRRIADTIEHFYGHLEIACCGSLGLCGVACREDAVKRREDVAAFLSAV